MLRVYTIIRHSRVHGYSYRGTTATQCFKKNGKKSHFLFYWSARNELFIWLVVLVIWREKFLIFRARALIFLFSNTVCREQRFSSGQFHLCKNFPRSFCQEKKKKEKRRSPGQFHFFPQLPKNGVDIVFMTLIDLRWQRRLLQTLTCCANKSTRFFFASRVDLNASNLRAVKVILITVMLAHLQLKQINLSSKLSHKYCWAVEIWPKKNWVEMLLLLLSEETEAEILCVPASFSTFSSALLRQHCPDWRMGVISWSSHIKMIPKWPLRNAWKKRRGAISWIINQLELESRFPLIFA